MAEYKELRIISGKWRSRKITFPIKAKNLRPTGSRVRETLFNWLMPYIQDAECLDLFAGSGILGFEALSRGAKDVLALEQSVEAIRKLKNNAKMLAARDIQILKENACNWLDVPVKQFDIIFLDPPYKDNLLGICLDKIYSNKWLKPDGFIYCESDQELSQAILQNWQVFRESKAGGVYFYLLKISEDAA